MIKDLDPSRVLSGHTSPETAYTVESYPYGFRLRCKIRYWIETVPGKGDRLCSQTTNPKVDGEVWNKPRKSVYQPVGVMFLDDEDQVQWTTIGYSSSQEGITAFANAVSGAKPLDKLSDDQLDAFKGMVAVLRAYQQITDAEKAGREAFERGEPRLVPQRLLTGEDGTAKVGENTRLGVAWYRGWDRANAAKPVNV